MWCAGIFIGTMIEQEVSHRCHTNYPYAPHKGKVHPAVSG